MGEETEGERGEGEEREREGKENRTSEGAQQISLEDPVKRIGLLTQSAWGNYTFGTVEVESIGVCL